MSEQWRDVVGYEGLYHVSDLGRVRRALAARGTFSGKILKPQVSMYGYHTVGLHHPTKRYSIKAIHRLVLIAFAGPCPPQHECNHKDGDRTNNCLHNLEWVTRSQNQRHRFDILNHPAPKGEAHHNAKLTTEQVLEIRSLAAAGTYSQTQLGERFGVSQDTISLIVNRHTWKHL